MDREATLLVKALSLITIGFLVGGFFLWGRLGKNPSPEFEPVPITENAAKESSPAVQHAKLTTPQEPEPDYEDPRDMSPDSWSQPPTQEEEEPVAPYLTFDENGMVVDSYLGNSRKGAPKSSDPKSGQTNQANSSTQGNQNQIAAESSSENKASRPALPSSPRSEPQPARPVEYGKLPESEPFDFAPLDPAPASEAASSPFVDQPPLASGSDAGNPTTDAGSYDLDRRDLNQPESASRNFAESKPTNDDTARETGDASPWSTEAEVPWSRNEAADNSTEQYDLGQNDVAANNADSNLNAENRAKSQNRKSAPVVESPMQRNPFYDPNDDFEPELPVDPNIASDDGSWRNPKFQPQSPTDSGGIDTRNLNDVSVESPAESQPLFEPSPNPTAVPTPVARPENGAVRSAPNTALQPSSQPEPIYRNPQFNGRSRAMQPNGSPSFATTRGPVACDSCDAAVAQPCVDCGRGVAHPAQSRCDGCRRAHQQSVNDCGLSGPLHRRRNPAMAANPGFGFSSTAPAEECWDAARTAGDYPPQFNPSLGFRQPSPTSRSQDLCGHPYTQSGEHYPSFGEILRTSRYFISTDLMLLKPYFQDNTVINIDNGGTTWGESMDFNHDPAFQMQAGFISPFGPGAGLDYFQYDQNAATRTFISDGMTTGTTRVVIPGGGGVSEIAATMPGESLSVDHSLEVHSYGAFIFKALEFRRASLTGKFGVRKVHIDQRMSAVLRDSMNAYVADLQHVMDFDGFGPQFGLEYRRKIGHTPLIFLTSLNNSLIFGNRDERIQNSCACQFFHTSSDELITILDLYSGVEGRKFVGEKRFLFGRLGYVNQNWLGGGTALDARNDFGFQGFAFSFGYNR